MTPAALRPFARAALAALFALAGCATMEGAPPEAAGAAAAAPPAAPAQSVANFGDQLRCMDYLLVDYGARDLAVSVDDRLNAGVRGMLASAVSDMTRRSRAIRLMAWGPDAGQTIRPQYMVRGSVSQADGTGVDLALMTAQDLAVVPGVTARNQVRSRRDPEVVKFGTRLRLPDGDAQALRPLVELSSIELFGRLAKVPYWTCLGATDDDPAVAAEIRDWYDAMAARPSEIIEYFQAQMRLRRLYEGPIDGVVNPQIKDAVARYREALGLSREPKLSQEFLKAYLKANHKALEARLRAPQTPVAVAAPVAAPPPAPLALRVAAENDARRFARGEVVQLTVKPSRDAHVYCFLQDENQKISRFFPNRFHRDSRVDAAQGVRLPGAMRFEIRMNPRGVAETVSCFATDRDVLPDLPATLAAADFDPLPVTTLEQVRNVFVNASGGTLAQENFRVQPK